MNPDTYLAERLDAQIAWYDKHSSRNQRWYKWLQVVVIVASAAIPFVSGYIDQDTAVLKVLVGALGLIVAAITTIIGVYQLQENWLRFRTTCEALRRERVLYLTATAPYDGDAPFPLLVERAEALMADETGRWADGLRSTGKAGVPAAEG